MYLTVPRFEDKSTEEVLSQLSEAQTKMRDDKETQGVVASLDMKALYPSLHQEETAAIVGRFVEESEIELQGIDWDMAQLIVASNWDQSRINKEGLGRFIPRRTKRKGRRPGPMNLEMTRKKWRDPKLDEPVEGSRRGMGRVQTPASLSLSQLQLQVTSDFVPPGTPVRRCNSVPGLRADEKPRWRSRSWDEPVEGSRRGLGRNKTPASLSLSKLQVTSDSVPPVPPGTHVRRFSSVPGIRADEKPRRRCRSWDEPVEGSRRGLGRVKTPASLSLSQSQVTGEPVRRCSSVPGLRADEKPRWRFRSWDDPVKGSRRGLGRIKTPASLSLSQVQVTSETVPPGTSVRLCSSVPGLRADEKPRWRSRSCDEPVEGSRRGLGRISTPASLSQSQLRHEPDRAPAEESLAGSNLSEDSTEHSSECLTEDEHDGQDKGRLQDPAAARPPESPEDPVDLLDTQVASKWTKPVKLSPAQKKIVLGCVFQIIILAVFRNHCFQFRGRLYKQSKGGPIGLRLTSLVARIVMDRWATLTIFKLDMAGAKIYAFMKYVDDVNVVLRSFSRGLRWQGKDLVWTQEAEDLDVTSGFSAEKITMLRVKEAAESVFPWLQFTVDLPEDHREGAVPMLDLQVWVQPQDDHPGDCSDPGQYQSLCWAFYEKPSSSCRVLRSTSAYTWRSKLVTMNMEMFRRLRNTSRQLAPTSRAKILGNFVHKLRASGYLQSTVSGMVQSGITYYYRKLRMDLEGGPPLNVRSDKDLVARRRSKAGAAKDWYARRRGGQDEVAKKLDPALQKPPVPGPRVRQRRDHSTTPETDWWTVMARLAWTPSLLQSRTQGQPRQELWQSCWSPTHWGPHSETRSRPRTRSSPDWWGVARLSGWSRRVGTSWWTPWAGMICGGRTARALTANVSHVGPDVGSRSRRRRRRRRARGCLRTCRLCPATSADARGATIPFSAWGAWTLGTRPSTGVSRLDPAGSAKRNTSRT